MLGLWILTLVLVGAASGATGSAFRDDFNLPDVESREGFGDEIAAAAPDIEGVQIELGG